MTLALFSKMTLKRVHNSAVVQETHFAVNAVNGNLEQTTDAEGNITTFAYFPNGDLQFVTGPRPGQLTRFTYDAFGNPETTTDAESNATTAVYDERSRLRSSTDTMGRSMTQDFDELDRVTTVTRTDDKGSSDTQVVVRNYRSGGQVSFQRNGLGLTTDFTYDDLNRVIATRDGLGHTTSMKYDRNSNVEEQTDRRGVTAVNTYDNLNRLTRAEIRGPFGPVQTLSEMDYDDVGNKLFETDIHGSRTDFVYDDLYRVRVRRLPTGHEERFVFDLVGNAVSQFDANGNETRAVYDKLNRVTSRTDAEDNEVRFEYDAAGNVDLQEDVTRGLITTATYDLLNRPLSRNLAGASPDAFTYETTFVYNDGAHEMVETDPRGFDQTTVLDDFDRAHEVRQQVDGGRELSTRNFYDAAGNLKQTEDAERRTTNFIYDGLSRLTEVRDALSQSTFFDYDGEGNKTEEINRRDLPTRFEYDNLGRLTRTEIDQPITGGGTLATSQMLYLDSQRKRVETDARGNSTTFEMDERQRVVKITDADNKVQLFEYDGVNKTVEIDKRGHRTEFRYDRINRFTEHEDALGQTIATDYRDPARQVVETDKKRFVNTTQLDALGRLISVTRSGIRLEQHTYDGNSNRTLSTDANGNQTRFLYDGANRLTERIDGLASTEQTRTTFLYDDVGNLLEEKDGRDTGLAFDIRNAYDKLNRLETTTDAEGNTTSFEYDAEGNRTAVIEPKSDTHRTEFDYGELNELIEVRMPDGGVYNYTYDGNRNRIRQEDGESNVVRFSYDRLNRVDLMIQDPGGFNYITNHDYDANGNETQLTDPKRQVIHFTYDELNRLDQKTYELTADDLALLTRTHEITYHYDPNDNLERVDELKSSGTASPAIVSSFKTYDTLDRLTSETDAWGRTLAYDYDPQGNRKSLTDPDSVQTEYTFDALNRLETLTLEARTPNAQTVVYEYFPDSLKKAVTNPNATSSTYTYDDADRMETLTHDGPGGVVSAYVYEYDLNGNRSQQIETNAGRTETTLYDYDQVNRLKLVTYEAGTIDATQVTYNYDQVGNRLTEQTVELETSTVTKDLVYDYEAINRLGAITDNLGGGQDVAYAYDANGNTLTKTKAGVATEFLYDIRDQLGEVRQDASVLGRYGFDYEGMRILKIGDDGIRHYTYDQLSVITEANTSNVTVSKYDYGLDQLVSLDNTSEGKSFFHLDILGSTANLTDGSGGTRQSILYDAWGNERERVGTSANKFGFTGFEKDDETGLSYARARFYDPDIGRFLSQDELLGAVIRPPTLHRYSYVRSNPLSFVDPTGHQAQSLGELGRQEREKRKKEPVEDSVQKFTNFGEGPGKPRPQGNATLTDEEAAQALERAEAGATEEFDFRDFNEIEGTVTEEGLGWFLLRKYVELRSSTQGKGGDFAEAQWRKLLINTEPSIRQKMQEEAELAFIDRDQNLQIVVAREARRKGEFVREDLVASTRAASEFVTGLAFDYATGKVVQVAVTAVGATVSVTANVATRVRLVARVKFDKAGRIRSAFAKIEVEHLGTGTGTTGSARRYAQAYGRSDDAGHLIGRALGGRGGRYSKNIVPQNAHVNRGAYRSYEQFVARRVAAGDDVYVRVVPRYQGQSALPTEIVYQVRVNGRALPPRVFRN